MNNFHYHNVDGDYRWCSHYQTSATACAVAAAMVDHNLSAGSARTGDDCNAMTRQIRWSCFDGDNVDETAAVELSVDNKTHWASVARLAPSNQ